MAEIEHSTALRVVDKPRVTDKSRNGHPASLDTLRLVLDKGGPGFAQFALNNACNANCGFCNFARDKFPKSQWKYVERQGALDAIDTLYKNGIRYLVWTGGEPTLHPDLIEFTEYASGLGMKVMLVSNAGLFKPDKVRRLYEAGTSSFIISVDAASVEAHENNRGLPGVCEKIKDTNRILKELGVQSTASVTMSRLLDYDKLPAFLEELGFGAVTFSYPVTELGSNFMGFSTSDLVSYSKEELLAAFDKVKALKKSGVHVLNPTAGLDEMKRYIQGGEQKFPCLGGYRYFYLDWDLMLWRCHYWAEPMCHISEFDETKTVRDGCTKCMIDCYRDSSVMHHVGVAVHDTYQAVKKGDLVGGFKALTRKGNLGSLGAVMEELPWLIRF